MKLCREGESLIGSGKGIQRRGAARAKSWRWAWEKVINWQETVSISGAKRMGGSAEGDKVGDVTRRGVVEGLVS